MEGWCKADILTLNSYVFLNVHPLLLKIKINCFYFFTYLRFKFFDCLTALPHPRGKTVIAWYLHKKKNTINRLTVGKFCSQPVLFNVVVCYTGTLYSPSEQLVIQRLLK